MILAFPILLFFLLIWVLTLLAWIEGLRAITRAADGKAEIQRRILPPLVFLTIPFVVLVIIFLLRLAVGRTGPAAHGTIFLALPGQMLIIAAASALVALITSMRAPRGFRGFAISASIAWLLCFGLALTALFALRGLR